MHISEIRTASCLENIVAIYQSLASSLKSVMLQLSSTGMGKINIINLYSDFELIL